MLVVSLVVNLIFLFHKMRRSSQFKAHEIPNKGLIGEKPEILQAGLEKYISMRGKSGRESNASTRSASDSVYSSNYLSRLTIKPTYVEFPPWVEDSSNGAYDQYRVAKISTKGARLLMQANNTSSRDLQALYSRVVKKSHSI